MLWIAAVADKETRIIDSLTAGPKISPIYITQRIGTVWTNVSKLHMQNLWTRHHEVCRRCIEEAMISLGEVFVPGQRTLHGTIS